MNDVELSHQIEERQAALGAVLHSATFLRNPRLGKLLRYLCEKSFAGESGSLKEYAIATDVFDRQADFDQSTDAIVRVEMHRLRKKLKDFYASEGQDQKFEIVIQSGNYAPEFLERHATKPVLPEAEWGPIPPEGLIKSPEQPISKSKSRSNWLLPLIVAFAAAAVITFYFASKNRLKSAGQVNSLAATASAVPVAADSSALRILAGGKDRIRDNDGNTWGPDQFFSGGTVQENAEAPIYRTRSGSLFRTARTGEFSYAIPLKNGFYELHLYFADTAYTPGISMEGGENTRFFNVTLNGHIILRNFDVIANAGPNTAYERVFKDVQPDKDGLLHVSFNREVGVPLLNAIEILPSSPHRIRPVRISAQDSGFTDKAGIAWQPDDYFLNGRSIAKYGIAAGVADSRIFARERYGHFSYAIPAAPGVYDLRLYFAETYFGPGQQGGGGAGDRVFDVYCNGVALLSGLDVFHEAGAAHQLIKIFSNIEPNAQGNVLISFVPRTNYAMISAIELIDETGQ